jgi:CheY-like chemotaxis protein
MAVIKILLVDDSQTVLMTERTVLLRNGYEVITARSAGEGLARALHERPDLLLVDADMPRVSGVEACRQLASDPLTAMIPVVLMVPPDLEPLAAPRRTWQAELGKPLLEHDLIATVRRFAGTPDAQA